MIEVVEKVDGEIVEKSYKAIVEEIKRKVTNAFTDEDAETVHKAVVVLDKHAKIIKEQQNHED